MRTKLGSAFFSAASCLFATTASATAPDSAKAVDHSSRHELCLSYNNPLNTLFENLYMNDYYYGGYNGSSGYPYFPFNNFSLPSYGLMYKYHPTDRLALRIGLDFNTSNTNLHGTNTSNNSSPTTESYGLSQMGASIGMEVNRGEGKAQWFAGGDLFYKHFSSSYSFTSLGSVDTYTMSNNAFGIAPLFGVRYYISKMISVSAESKLNVSYNSYTIDEVNSSSGGNANMYTYTGGGLTVKISPIGQLGVNVHF